MERGQFVSTIFSLPDDVEGLIEGLSDDQLRVRLTPGDWSIIEICCHLRDAGEMSALRIRRLAAEDDPTIEPYDEQALAAERQYHRGDLGRVLPAVRSAWTGLAAALEGLPAAAWQRGGRHPERGRVTIASEARRYANHAGEHLRQVRAIVSSVQLSRTQD